MLSESRLTFVERSPQVDCWKQADFGEKLSKTMVAFVESLRKPFKYCVNCDNSQFRNKMVHLGGPFFRRRPWPFGKCQVCVPPTSATLYLTKSLMTKMMMAKVLGLGSAGPLSGEGILPVILPGFSPYPSPAFQPPSHRPLQSPPRHRLTRPNLAATHSIPVIILARKAHLE